MGVGRLLFSQVPGRAAKARQTTCEHVFVMYADGLLLVFELADREDERFQLAAARWHARFVLEAGLLLREAEGVMTLLCRLRGADRQVVRRRLLAMVERAGLTTTEIRSHA
jgi:adenosylmethionine-8-amino-7-oxononanoate aminotransferase